MTKTLGQIELKKLLSNWVTLQEAILPQERKLEELRKKQDKIAHRVIEQFGKNNNFIVKIKGEKWLVQVLSKSIHIVPLGELKELDGDHLVSSVGMQQKMAHMEEITSILK